MKSDIISDIQNDWSQSTRTILSKKKKKEEEKLC